MFAVESTSVEIIGPSISVRANAKAIHLTYHIHYLTLRSLGFLGPHRDKGLKLRMESLGEPCISPVRLNRLPLYLAYMWAFLQKVKFTLLVPQVIGSVVIDTGICRTLLSLQID